MIVSIKNYNDIKQYTFNHGLLHYAVHSLVSNSTKIIIIPHQLTLVEFLPGDINYVTIEERE